MLCKIAEAVRLRIEGSVGFAPLVLLVLLATMAISDALSLPSYTSVSLPKVQI